MEQILRPLKFISLFKDQDDKHDYEVGKKRVILLLENGAKWGKMDAKHMGYHIHMTTIMFWHTTWEFCRTTIVKAEYLKVMLMANRITCYVILPINSACIIHFTHTHTINQTHYLLAYSSLSFELSLLMFFLVMYSSKEHNTVLNTFWRSQITYNKGTCFFFFFFWRNRMKKKNHR